MICFAKNSNFAVLPKHFRISRNTLLLLSPRNLNVLNILFCKIVYIFGQASIAVTADTVNIIA